MRHVTFLRFIYTSFAELWERGRNPQTEMHRVSKVFSTNEGHGKNKRIRKRKLKS